MINKIYNGTTGKLIEVKEDDKTLWSKKEELKDAQKEIIDKLKAKGKLNSSEAQDIKEKLKGGKK